VNTIWDWNFLRLDLAVSGMIYDRRRLGIFLIYLLILFTFSIIIKLFSSMGFPRITNKIKHFFHYHGIVILLMININNYYIKSLLSNHNA